VAVVARFVETVKAGNKLAFAQICFLRSRVPVRSGQAVPSMRAYLRPQTIWRGSWSSSHTSYRAFPSNVPAPKTRERKRQCQRPQTIVRETLSGAFVEPRNYAVWTSELSGGVLVALFVVSCL
jgi:hypothetical protein